MNSREWSIKITMSMDKSVASDYTLIIQFKSSDSKHQNNALYDLYGNVSDYVLSNSTQTTTIPKVYLAAGIVNGAAAPYYYYDFWLYNPTIADTGMCYAQINSTYGFIWDGAKYSSCSEAVTKIPPSIIYNSLNSNSGT